MSEHEEHEWIPPREDETILGFNVTDEKPTPPNPGRVNVSTPAVERFATLATGIIMYSMLGIVVILIAAVVFRVFKWAFGL